MRHDGQLSVLPRVPGEEQLGLPGEQRSRCRRTGPSARQSSPEDPGFKMSPLK